MRKLLLLPALGLLVSFSALGQEESESSLQGTWKATFVDSISTGTLYLVLNVQSDGTVSGTVQQEGTNLGRISGRPDGSTFYFTLVQTLEGCPGSFSGKITLEADSGTGTYVGTDCEGEHQNGVVSIVRDKLGEGIASAPTASPPKPSLADCGMLHAEENYVSWFCDAEGKVQRDKADIFYLRKTLADETIAVSVWSGPTDDWKKAASEVISHHKKKTATCAVYVNVSNIPREGAIRWDWLSNNMLKWWKKELAKEFPGFCYAKEPWEADYVVVWTDSYTSIPYSFSIPVPQTSYVTGTTSGWVGGEYVQGSYSGYVYSTQTQTYSGVRGEWYVTAWVIPVKRNTRLVFESKHSGRWRWSKPDKDALVDAVKFIQGQLPSK